MRHVMTAIGLALTGLMAGAAADREPAEATTAKRADDAVVVSSDGREVVRYQLAKPAGSKLPVDSACYLHPQRTPSGLVVTDVAPADHPHHRGVFLAWFDMKGKAAADFWGWGAHAPVEGRRIVNRGVEEMPAGFVATNEWLAGGEVLLAEQLDVRAQLVTRADRTAPANAAAAPKPLANVLDLTYTLTADADLTLPRRAFSGFCVRVAGGAKVEAFGPDGLVKLPNPHHEQPDTDWPAAKWYAYQLTLDGGKAAAVVVIDHPENPPSLWHNQRDVRMLNPCVVAPGPVTIKADEPLVLRYRVIALDGTVGAARALIDWQAEHWE
jgi:hypothetical protein